MDLTDFNFILFISNYVIPDKSSVFYTSCKLECAFMTDYSGHQSFFYHPNTMACITLPDKIYSTQNLVSDHGFQYWISNVISSCKDIKRCKPSYVDGEYWLYPAIYNFTRVKIYCHGLSSSQPKEFVTLHYLNKVITLPGEYSGPQADCYIDENRLHGPDDGDTEWEKIRLDIKSGNILADHTFTIQTSGVPKPYGEAVGCSNVEYYLSCPKRGYGLVDVRDTGFKLSSSSTWETDGFEGFCDIIERTTYRFEGKGDGHCGGCYPNGNLSLELDSATVPELLTAIEPTC